MTFATNQTLTNDFNVLETLRGSFVKVSLKGAGTLRKSIAYRDGRDTLAAAKGADANALTVSMKLFPKGYDAEITALTKAYSAVRQHFYYSTLPFGTDGAGRAEGARLMTTDGVLQGRILSSHQSLIDELDQARWAFANNISYLVQGIQHSGLLGVDFSHDLYPSYADIMQSFTYVPLEDTMEFISNPADLAGLRLDGQLAERVSKTMAQRALAQYKFGLQSEAKRLLGYLDNMAGNLGELVAHRTTPDGPGAPTKVRTKAPRIHDSLVGNVKDAVEKLRTYAVPDTADGAALLEIADKVEESLSLDRLTADHLKASVALAEKAGKRASTLAENLRASLNLDDALDSLDS